MAESKRSRLSQEIGWRVREIREERGLSQDQLAARLRERGLRWNRSMLAKLERGERTSLTVEESLILAFTLTIPLYELVRDDDDWLALTPQASARKSAVRRILSGADAGRELPRDWPSPWTARSAKALQRHLVAPVEAAKGYELADQIQRIWPGAKGEDLKAVEEAMSSDVERKAARKLGLEPFELSLLARRLWSRSLTEEREARLQASGTDPRGRQALRGHVTRALMAELARAAKEQGS